MLSFNNFFNRLPKSFKSEKKNALSKQFYLAFFNFWIKEHAEKKINTMNNKVSLLRHNKHLNPYHSNLEIILNNVIHKENFSLKIIENFFKKQFPYQFLLFRQSELLNFDDNIFLASYESIQYRVFFFIYSQDPIDIRLFKELAFSVFPAYFSLFVFHLKNEDLFLYFQKNLQK